MVIQNPTMPALADSPTIRAMLVAENHAPVLAAADAAHAAAASPFEAPRLRQLGAAFFADLNPTPLAAPHWIAHDHRTAQSLQLPTGWHEDATWLHTLSGNPGLPVQPLATVYSGHQFGVWAGQLGDGRAILLGERAGLEVQLKGAGPTPFSRRADGRAVLRSSVREFLASQAMRGLGIPSTSALCLTGSPATVWREQAETAAVVTRVAPSFIRFGHFEHFAAKGDTASLQQLADFVIAQYYPACLAASESPYLALLRAVTQRSAELVALWQSVGFCHGVLNTDNMSILGLTLDYGPFQFLDAFDPAHICNHSDTQGRYAFNRQPGVVYWNLFCLGQALLPLIDDHDATVAVLETFKPTYAQAFDLAMARKLGFSAADPALTPLHTSALELLAAQRVDFTLFWRRLSQRAAGMEDSARGVQDLFIDPSAALAWLDTFDRAHAQLPALSQAPQMLRTNPAVVLRNHLGELAIRAAQAGDFAPLAQLQSALDAPFEEPLAYPHFTALPPDWAQGIEISCSS